jgi:hypothetical protein
VGAAEAIHSDTHSWCDRDRPPFARDAIREVEAFEVRCQQFSDLVGRNAPVDQLRQEVVRLYEQYKRVFEFIRQSRGRERGRLADNANRTKSALVDLRILLEI